MFSKTFSRNLPIARVPCIIRILVVQANWPCPMVPPLCTGLGALNGGDAQLKLVRLRMGTKPERMLFERLVVLRQRSSEQFTEPRERPVESES